MTPKQRKLAHELITNPPPGSAIAAAKEWGVDLTLLYENLLRTPTERSIFRLNSSILQYFSGRRKDGPQLNEGTPGKS